MEKKIYEKLEKVGTYGWIVVTKSIITDWLYDGTTIENETLQYNIELEDGSLVCNEWFDTYNFECNGRCIIGYKRNSTELEALSRYYGYPNNETMVIEEFCYRYGAINTKGNFVVPAIYDRLSFDNEDAYIAYHNGKLGYVDSELGIQITPIVFNHAESFYDGQAYVEYEDISSKKKGYINRKNEFGFNLSYWLKDNPRVKKITK